MYVINDLLFTNISNTLERHLHLLVQLLSFIVDSHRNVIFMTPTASIAGDNDMSGRSNPMLMPCVHLHFILRG